MRVYLGSDHAGFELKNHLVEWLTAHGHEPVDCGPHIYDAQDDYPPFCLRAAEKTAADPDSLGIVIGGSGNGEQIAANKVKGVRAALAWSEETAKLGREHNDANVISVGGRMHTEEEATKFVEIFLATPYSGEERHTRRIDMLSAYETTGELPADPRPPPAGLTPVHPVARPPRPPGRAGAPTGGHPCPRGIRSTASPWTTAARFEGEPVRVSSPQGKFTGGAALVDGQVTDDRRGARQAPLPRLRRGPLGPCPPRAVRQARLRHGPRPAAHRHRPAAARERRPPTRTCAAPPPAR